jgi:hypothetical protein
VFSRGVAALLKLHAETKDHVQFLLVYVREAHAADEWVMPDNERRGLHFEQPTTLTGRSEAAAECAVDLALPMTTVVDGLDDAVSSTYGGWPDRLYVIGADGRVVYQSGVGPFGFKPDEVREVLRANYGF